MLEVLVHHNSAEIRITRPPVNAINLDLLRSLRQHLHTLVHEGVRGIILSGTPGMFSAGVDVPALLQASAEQQRDFWHEFFQTGLDLAQSPIPLVAAITGHNPAGGAVLTLFCDYRVMAEGPYQIGLNEVQVGLAVPECIQFALRRIVGAHVAGRLLMSGTMLNPDTALHCGLVDETTRVEQVITQARKRMDALLSLPEQAMLTTRHIARADLRQVWSDMDALCLDGFFAAFHHPQTQSVLEKLATRLQSKT